MPTGNSTEPWLAMGGSDKMYMCLGKHGKNFIVSKGKPAVSSRHRPWAETREAESVFWPICAVQRNAVLDEWKQQGILRELGVRGLVWDVLLSVQNVQEKLG